MKTIIIIILGLVCLIQNKLGNKVKKTKGPLCLDTYCIKYCILYANNHDCVRCENNYILFEGRCYSKYK
jgi:hypothetical protein